MQGLSYHVGGFHNKQSRNDFNHFNNCKQWYPNKAKGGLKALTLTTMMMGNL